MIKLFDILWRYACKPGKNLFSVEVTTRNRELCFVLSSYEKKNKALEIRETINCKRLEELQNRVNPNTPLIWVYNTDDVLFFEPGKWDSEMLTTLFSTTDTSNFFTQKTAESLILLRQDKWKAFHDKILENNLPIADLFLSYQPLFEFLHWLPEKCRLPAVAFRHDSKNILKFTPLSEPVLEKIVLNNHSLRNDQLLGFTAVLHFLDTRQKMAPIKVENPWLKKGIAQWRQPQNKLKKAYCNQVFAHRLKRYFIPGFLILLVLNFGMYLRFNSKLKETVLESQKMDVKLLEIQTLEKNLRLKQDLLQKYQSLPKSEAAFFIHTLLNPTPNGVYIDRLAYQPLDNGKASEADIAVLEHIVVMEGHITEKNDFSRWIETLKTSKRIHNVRMEHYGYGNKNRLNFKIKIETLPQSESKK